ncbi:hypothetical protein Tco_0129522 [Tanacetum coccineum]
MTSFDVNNPLDSIFVCMNLLVLVWNMLLDSFPYLDYSKLVHLYLCFNLARAICNCLEVYHDHVIIALMACTYPGRCDSSRRSFGRIMVLSRKEAGYADECRKLLEDQPLIVFPLFWIYI